MGVLYIACLALVFTVCNAHTFESDDMLEKLRDRYHDYEDMLERKEEVNALNDLDKLETLEDETDTDRNGNRDTCDAISVKCHHCTQCWPGGWCVTGKSKYLSLQSKYSNEGALYCLPQYIYRNKEGH